MEEEKYIMPYISDKNLYKAVMLACKIIREKHWFNYAINSACNYYGVEREDVEKYVRLRQGTGQKRANAKKPPRKYFYYCVEACQTFGTSWKVVKATSENNAIHQVFKCYEKIMGEKFGDNFWLGAIKVFDNKEDCKRYAERKNHEE